jgi:hypothetical protein
VELTAAEKDLALAIDFDEDICRLLKQFGGAPLRRLTRITEDYKEKEADGISISVERREVGPLIAKLQSNLRSNGYRAFWSEYRRPDGMRTDELVVVKTTSEFEIIRLRRTDGANYGVMTEDVIAKLSQWRDRFEFEILGAASDWIAIEFKTLPQSICRFAEEVYLFCPDTVEQGVGLLRESDHPEVFEAARALCPALSPEMQERLQEQGAEFEEMDIPGELLEMLDSGMGYSTPTEMGIRLLAHEIRRSKQLYLWWD